MKASDVITFRGAALGEPGNPENPVDPLIEFLTADYVRVGDRNYPPQFADTLGRYRPNPRDVERVRDALRGIPGVNPEDYDLLFNSELREWTIVKWVDLPEPRNYVMGLGDVIEVVREPYPVYEIDARKRGPGSLSDLDWTRLRRRCTRLRDPGEIDREIYEHNLRVTQEQGVPEEAELAFAEYFHRLFRKIGEETGVAYATPEEMAKKYGGRPQDWDPDYIPGETI